MRLTHPILREPLSFDESHVQVLIVENQRFFTEFIFSLNEQSEGSRGPFVLSKNFEPVDMKDELDVIVDYFHLSGDNKRIQMKLGNYIKSIATQELSNEASNLMGELNIFFNMLTENIDYPVSFQSIVDVAPVIKLGGIHVDLEKSNLVEKLLDYMLVLKELCGASLFVLVNLKSYLNIQDLSAFYKLVLYKKLKILVLEARAHDITLEFENIRIIDDEMCELFMERGE